MNVPDHNEKSHCNCTEISQFELPCVIYFPVIRYQNPCPSSHIQRGVCQFNMSMYSELSNTRGHSYLLFR